eukprot:CAMPEP_0115827966 /NCGR_PEP_ID=MMETSP0287-20121206/328_1 /TAXON_ID=412157 /ORGANISM="Chrysochromulina rotalis, Strain UIO044" /LENGTH=148 /DNA_ID=CAMNT_0003281163 /DNA_START=294 /DNA_END=738 /DNA_ORIENTATION=+
MLSGSPAASLPVQPAALKASSMVLSSPCFDSKPYSKPPAAPGGGGGDEARPYFFELVDEALLVKQSEKSICLSLSSALIWDALIDAGSAPEPLIGEASGCDVGAGGDVGGGGGGHRCGGAGAGAVARRWLRCGGGGGGAGAGVGGGLI